jgi:hypothetical protein
MQDSQKGSAMTRIALIALALAATTTAASAHDYGRGERIDERQAEQARRIARAKRHGELTWFERQKLVYEQAKIRRLERAARRDGYVSRSEYRRINEALNEAGRDIYRESHDRQKSWWRRTY